MHTRRILLSFTFNQRFAYIKGRYFRIDEIVERGIDMSNPLGSLLQKIAASKGRDLLFGKSGHKKSRRSARSKVRLPLRATILGTEFEMDNVRYSPTLNGYTTDLSDIGLALMLPAAKMDGLDLSGQYRRLKIMLDLPAQQIEIYATIIYHDQHGKGYYGESGYLIGARITKISHQHSEHLKAYLITSH